MVKAAVALVLAAAACIGLLLLANRSPDETPVKAEPPAVSVQPDQTLLNLARAEVAWARQKKADLWAPQEMAALEARLAQGTTDMDGGAFNQACRDIRREAKELAESAPARLPAFLQSLRNAYQEARSEEDAKRVAALANVALEIDPECAEAKSILQRAGNRPRVLLLAEQASAAEKRRDWKEAYDLVEEARKLDPDDPRLGQQAERVGGIYAESEHRRARELEEAGKWQQATEAARRACALAAENATYAATKSRIERSAATFQATQWLEEATQKETDGQLDEALSLYQKVGRLTSADLSPEAKALLGRGLSRLPGLLATRETQRVLGEWERLRQQEDWAKARDLLRNTKVDLVSPAVLDRFAGAKALTDRMIDLRERLVAFRSVADVAERLPAARELLRDLAKEAELGQDTGKRRDQLVKWRVAATKPVLVRFVSDNTYRLSVTVHAFDGDTGKATKHYEPFAELELLLPPGRHAYKAWGWAGHAALDRIGFSVGPGDPAKTIRIIGHKDQ